MASPASGPLAAPPIPRNDIIREIEAIIATPLTTLTKAEADAPRLRVITLFQQLIQIKSTTSEETKEVASLKDRVTIWTKTLPPAASGAGTAAPGVSIPVRAEIDRRKVIDAFNILHVSCYGTSQSCMPYIFALAVQYDKMLAASAAGSDGRILKLLDSALLSLDKGSAAATAKFKDFFIYIEEALRLKRIAIDPVIILGLHVCQIGRLDVLLNPLQNELDAPAAVIPVDKMPLETASSAVDPSLLLEILVDAAYQSGCRAAGYVGYSAYSLSHIVSGVLWPRLDDVCFYVFTETIEKIEALNKQKRIGFLKMLDEHPLYKRMRPEFRSAIYLQMRSYTKELVKTENALKDLHRQLVKYYHSLHPQILALVPKLKLLAGMAEGPEKSAIQFSLFMEHREVLFSFNSQMLGYIDEFIACLEQCLHHREISLYLSFLPFDPAVDWSEVSSTGLLAFLSDYTKTHPRLECEGLPLPAKTTMVKNLEALDKGKETLTILQTVRDELKKVHNNLDVEYTENLLALEALHRGRVISVDEEGSVIFSLPAEGSHFYHGYDKTALRPALASMDDPSLLAVDRAVDVDTSEHAAGGAAPLPAPLAEAAYSSPVIEALDGLRRILIHARTSNQFTAGTAKQAFANALHYSEALCTLLSELDEKNMQAKQLADLQQDIATAAFYACEQLLTAILHENLKTGTMAGSKELYQELGHRLMGRFLEAGLSKNKELQKIVPMLRNLEGVGSAVLDPFTSYVSHPLIGNLSALVSKGSRLAEPTEKARALFAGQDALKAFCHLLLCEGCAATAASKKTADAYFEVLSSAPMLAATADAKAAGGASSPPAEIKTLKDIREIIHRALLFSKSFESSERRRLAIMHNLDRLNHLRTSITDPKKLPLVPFYANQIRFLLRNILEEFLSAACENVNTSFDQRAAKHDLALLAKEIKLFARLDPKERLFLQESHEERNEARYGFKAAAHAAIASGAGEAVAHAKTTSGAGGEECLDEFTHVFSGPYANILRLVDAEIAMTVGLCTKISNHSFKI